MITDKPFKIVLNYQWTQTDDIFKPNSTKFILVTNPYQIHYKKLFERITFGLYKAPYEYIVKQISRYD